MSSSLQQSLGEAEVFDLVCDYLRTRQFFEAERTLRTERERDAAAPAAQSANNNNNNNNTQYYTADDANANANGSSSNHDALLASRLEFMLERSYVTQLVSGNGDAKPEKIYVPRHELPDVTPTPVRTNLDGNEALVTTNDDDANANANANTNANANANDDDDDTFSTNTKLVAFEACRDDPHGSAVMPIYQTSTFAQPSATNFGAYDYTRSGNPTRAALERQMAELEGGARAFAFTSGMAALSAVSRLAKAGDEILLSDDSYGGTYRLLSKVAAKNGVSVKYVDLSSAQGPKNLQQALSAQTKLVMMESPTNPLQRVCDIRALAEVAHSVGALLSVDNTMMSPMLQNPLVLGADIVMHSATKFICGHSDTMAGILVAKDPELCREIYFFQNAEGTGLAPFDCWLLLRGVKTMGLRVLQAQENAQHVASFLQDHPLVTHTYYSGLLPAQSVDRRIHDGQARGAGSVVCFRTGSLALSQHIVTVTKLFKITVSFGSVNSLISLPGAMSHASIPEEVRKARSFPEDLVRLSIGIEDVKDLIKDLSRAFQTFEASTEEEVETKNAETGIVVAEEATATVSH